MYPEGADTLEGVGTLVEGADILVEGAGTLVDLHMAEVHPVMKCKHSDNIITSHDIKRWSLRCDGIEMWPIHSDLYVYTHRLDYGL